MIVLIDNYDSFSYNLYQLLGQFDPDITVIRNDEKTVEAIEAMRPDHLIISPGPGRPADAGICEQAISYFAGKVPILGVCLGHQAICEVYGGTITYAKQLMHGKQSVATLKTDSPLFKGLPEQVDVGRYHSLALDRIPCRMNWKSWPIRKMVKSWPSAISSIPSTACSSIPNRF